MTDRRAPAGHLADARLIWDYHLVGHEPRPCSAAIGLGSHDIGVATFAAELYHAGMFPVLVFSGATSATTEARFPRGEAVEFAEHAVRLGVPASAIIIEPRAANTGQNIGFSRAALAAAGVEVTSLMLISKPYMERRALATARKAWPEADLVCASQPVPFEDYLEAIGDERFVIDMIVGDLQRVIEYPSRGFAVHQDVPADVQAAYRRLTTAGFTSRLAP
ncbi:YdcF family protein [Spirillospora albida]|uniref:YdcF family protein n=1 Tax=Spirillospora albida TaxID=58123 RepID=UPI0005693519|nr:YdcF family protein [Spirillospora albida]